MAIPEAAVHALQRIAYTYRRLDVEAGDALDMGNLNGFNSALDAAAHQLISMPGVVRGLLDDSPESAEVLRAVDAWAGEADRYLSEENYLAIGNFLLVPGTTLDEPNQLERLIAAHSADEV